MRVENQAVSISSQILWPSACPSPSHDQPAPLSDFSQIYTLVLLGFSSVQPQGFILTLIGITKITFPDCNPVLSKWKKLSTPQNPLQISFLFWLLIPAWFPLSSLPLFLNLLWDLTYHLRIFLLSPGSSGLESPWSFSNSVTSTSFIFSFLTIAGFSDLILVSWFSHSLAANPVLCLTQKKSKSYREENNYLHVLWNIHLNSLWMKMRRSITVFL